MKTRLTNSLLIGDIFGMLFFGIAADRIGRKWGIIGCTVLLVGGVILATAAHGQTVDGMLWMMVVSKQMSSVRARAEDEDWKRCGRSRSGRRICCLHYIVYRGSGRSTVVCLVLRCNPDIQSTKKTGSSCCLVNQCCYHQRVCGQCSYCSSGPSDIRSAQRWSMENRIRRGSGSRSFIHSLC